MKLTHQIAILLAAASLTGCTKEESEPTAPPVSTDKPSAAADALKKEVKEAAQATGTYLAETREQFVESAQRGLKEMDANIEALSQKTSSLAGDAKAQAESMLSALREKRQKAGAELEKVKAATQETWSDVKQGCHTMLEDLKQAYADIKAKLG